MRLYITGFSGTGKSTLARNLAHNLGITYTDLDDLTVTLSGKTTVELFSEGEEIFRSFESEALREAKADIIATGGGTVTVPENLAYMKAQGKILLLFCSPQVIIERLALSETRPLISDLTSVKKLLFSRAYAYNEADYYIDTACFDSTAVAAEAERFLCLKSLF